MAKKPGITPSLTLVAHVPMFEKDEEGNMIGYHWQASQEHHQYENPERLDRIVALTRKSLRDRPLFLNHERSGWDANDIAKRHGLPPGTVYRIAFRPMICGVVSCESSYHDLFGHQPQKTDRDPYLALSESGEWLAKVGLDFVYLSNPYDGLYEGFLLRPKRSVVSITKLKTGAH